MIDSPIKLLKYFKFDHKLLSSASSVKHIVKFSNTPMQELRGDLQRMFDEHHVSYFVNSATDDNMSFNLSSGNAKTVLMMLRHRHKPLEIEIIADHKMNSAPDYIKRRSSSNSSDNSRYLWYGLFLFGFIVTMLVVFVQVLIGIIEAMTPGWNQSQRILGIFGFTALVVFYVLYVIPLIRKQRNKATYNFNSQIVALVTAKLEAIHEATAKNHILRCWSCFKEMDMNDDFCPNCGKQQN